MALWFSLAVNGLDAYRDALVAGNEMARYLADQIKAHPDLELVREPDLSVLLFRRNGWTNGNYDQWSTDLLERQVAFVTSSTWQGETVGRLVFLHPGTTTAMVDDVLAALN